MSAQSAECPACGTTVEHDPTSLEQKLAVALQHPLPEARARICWILGQRRRTWAVPYLLHILRDVDLHVRLAALRALGEIGDETAIPVLERAAEDWGVLMRVAARGALEQIRVRQTRRNALTEKSSKHGKISPGDVPVRAAGRRGEPKT